MRSMYLLVLSSFAFGFSLAACIFGVIREIEKKEFNRKLNNCRSICCSTLENDKIPDDPIIKEHTYIGHGGGSYSGDGAAMGGGGGITAPEEVEKIRKKAKSHGECKLDEVCEIVIPWAKDGDASL